MNSKVHTFQLDPDFKMIGHMSAIDRFGGEWSGIAKREGAQTLKQLKSVATVESTGASTRIEGSRMSDDEVRAFIFNRVKIEKLEERDQQEVKGYFRALDIIGESYNEIEITEANLKGLHNELMRYSEKDQWHKGNYKQHPNSVEAINSDGSRTIIFNTTPPGVETEDAMLSLIQWYNNDYQTPTLIKSALFVYDFLSIHPFQDGNGRLSRLLGTLLLLKNNYPWIEYVSFEHEIETRKAEYYQVLMDCQHHRPGENVTSWVHFFLDCMANIQEKLKKKLEVQKRGKIAPREKMIYTFIENHPGCSSGEISKQLNIPLPTVKKSLTEMVNDKLITKHGSGSGTNYTTETLDSVAVHRRQRPITYHFAIANSSTTRETVSLFQAYKNRTLKNFGNDDDIKVELKNPPGNYGQFISDLEPNPARIRGLKLISDKAQNKKVKFVTMGQDEKPAQEYVISCSTLYGDIEFTISGDWGLKIDMLPGERLELYLRLYRKINRSNPLEGKNELEEFPLDESI
ncbi:MAG: MarR family transcriptional regulator [Bacteroidetes bacterium]|nr:MAG: MarR family transcriptional regulator [Bacteroidota bacterium]